MHVHEEIESTRVAGCQKEMEWKAKQCFMLYFKEFRVCLHVTALMAEYITSLMLYSVMEGIHTYGHSLKKCDLVTLHFMQRITI